MQSIGQYFIQENIRITKNVLNIRLKNGQKQIIRFNQVKIASEYILFVFIFK